MRILQVTPFLGEQHGGSERYAYEISKQLVQHGHHVDIYTSRLSSHTPSQSTMDGIHIHRFWTHKIIWNINPLCFMLRALLKADHDITHVHSYLYFTANQALLAKCLKSLIRRALPLMLHLHGGVGNPPLVPHAPLRKIAKRIYDYYIGRWMMRQADCVTSTDRYNAHAASRLFKLNPATIPIIHNGIDLTKFPPNHHTHRSQEILYVGDLEPWKGVQTLIKAFNHLHKRDNAFRLTIVGDGSLLHHLKAQATNSQVEFTGHVPHAQIPHLMRRAYAVVLPSLWEGIPTVGLEAMASKTPFIGSRVGGIPEILHHNTTGLLIPPNDPRAIVRAILQLADPQLRTTIVDNARTQVEKEFSISTICTKLESLYKSIAN